MVRSGVGQPRLAPRSAPSRPAGSSPPRERGCSSGGLAGSAVDSHPSCRGRMWESLRGGARGDASGAPGTRAGPGTGSASAARPARVLAPGRCRPSGGDGHRCLAALPPRPGRRRSGERSRCLARGSAALPGFVFPGGSRPACDQGRSLPTPQALEVADRVTHDNPRRRRVSPIALRLPGPNISPILVLDRRAMWCIPGSAGFQPAWIMRDLRPTAGWKPARGHPQAHPAPPAAGVRSMSYGAGVPAAGGRHPTGQALGRFPPATRRNRFASGAAGGGGGKRPFRCLRCRSG